ncbi:cytochrome P450 [Streptomyces tirandamycinicus]|uniref:cytochrome P450 n=1 Tax=Streptomyces tirandamycinicus TaxID=2174846 RepID=UPI000377C259|nr:cytochrome P450 [Streptomyces tirandamycinicus]MCY0982958.1 cytochrome P450 [Streptomyces tirandamycinicus]
MKTSEPGTPAAAADSGPPEDEGVRRWGLEDLTALDFDPFLTAVLREEPVARIRLPYGEGTAWLVTRHDDVKSVASDPRFSRRALADRDVTSGSPHAIAARHASLNYTDPPRLTAMRRVVARAFTGGGMERLRPLAQRTADELLDEMERHGPPADLVRHLHGPFPLSVVGDLLGLPEEDRTRMVHWTDVIMTPAPAPARSRQGRRSVREVVEALLAQRRAEPADDLAGVLAAAAADGEISDDEALSMATAILVSGAHAVRNNSANMVYALLTRPEQLARLRAEPGLLPRAVEELLRYIPHRSGVGLPRIATEDVEVGGVRIRAGEAVYCSYLAANRDPEVFPDPHTLDFDRPAVPHLSFGFGPHHCVGPMLARMESEVMLATLLRRYPRLTLAVPPDEIAWQRGALIRGPKSLPVSW